MEDLSKIVDLRSNIKKPIGNIIEATGDTTMGFFTTDKGYRLVLDGYNLKKISDYYEEKTTKKSKQETTDRTKAEG